MNVLPVLDAVLTRLREKLPQLQVEYFPEKPAEYRLNHPVGALLVSYAGSRFDKPNDIGAVLQTQTIQLCVTVVFRQLNGKRGAIDVLDAVRRILGGYTPPNCRRRIWLTARCLSVRSRGCGSTPSTLPLKASLSKTAIYRPARC